jgi:hypothetical protein
MWYLHSLLMLFILISACTIIGRHLCMFLPWRLMPLSKFYLSPCLGLAFLMFLALLIGWTAGFKIGLWVKLIAFAIALAAFYFEKEKKKLFDHLKLVNLFAFVSSFFILFSVLYYDTFNIINDTFTYLVHGQWLQDHSYSESFQASGLHPALTQVSLYQKKAYRMGGSFFLGMIQSIFGTKWSYTVYPVAVALPLVAGSLAIGYCSCFCGFRRRWHGMLIGLLSALSLGGFANGSITGFLPQTYGLAYAISFLGATGNVLNHIGRFENWRKAVFWTIPLAMLFSALVYSYSELVPFTCAAVMLAGILFFFAAPSKKTVIFLVACLLIQSVVLLNNEIVRAVKAIWAQSKATVGYPVDWSIIDFIGHSFGLRVACLHCDAWFFASKFLSLLLLFLILYSLKMSARQIFRKRSSGLLPCGSYILVSSLAFLYFRYIVPSPWPVGAGQTWSQFKIAVWLSPFCLVFVGVAILHMLRSSKKYSSAVLVALLLCLTVGMIQNCVIVERRTRPFLDETGYQRSSFEAFLNLRNFIQKTVGSKKRIYVDLENHRLKQMATYFLVDFELSGNWLINCFLYSQLPSEERNIPLSTSEYMITHKNSNFAKISDVSFGNLVFMKTPAPDGSR